MTFTVDPAVLARGSVQIDLHDHVLDIILNRPDVRNAMTPAMWSALEAIGEAITPDVRVVVVKGAGAGFSAGLDRVDADAGGPCRGESSFAEVLKGSDTQVAEVIAGYQRGYLWLRRPDIISIAAVHGHCIGGGFQLALACDLRIAAEDASFSMREPALGLVPDLTGTKPLVEAVGYSRALEMVVSARNVPADEALTVGLVQQVVPTDELDDAAAGTRLVGVPASARGRHREQSAAAAGGRDALRGADPRREGDPNRSSPRALRLPGVELTP